MRIGVVTDATCDLPDAFLREHRIEVMPIPIRLDGRQLTDARDPAATARFYAEHLAGRGHDAETEAPRAEDIRHQFLQRIVLEYDYVFCITAMSSRTDIFANASKASFAILSDYKTIRAEHGIDVPFALRVVDSKNMFSGTGVLVAEAAKLARAGVNPNEVRVRIDSLREHICGYLVPNDLYYIHKRGLEKGEKSVGFLTYAFGSAFDIKPVILCFQGDTQPVAKIRNHERAVEKLFDHVTRQIEIGIDTGHVCVSYGGDSAVIASLPGFARMAETARGRGIEVLRSTMSATAAVSLGAQCVTVAYGGELRAFGD
ncbi:MAG: DegV family protein [Nevskiales bacterium]|nr:DegV family protein [Nevskiales bacterium]